jgi:hypothetical protein
MLFPTPVVVDADVLIRNVEYVIRTGRTGALLVGASGNYTLISGVVLFAAAEIGGEAIRHLPDIAARRAVTVGEVYEIWNALIVPNVRFVNVDVDDVHDPRVDEVRKLHSADVYTAALVALLVECVLATDNRRHFRPFGLPRFNDVPTDTVALDLFSLSQFGMGVKGTMLVPTLAGAATIEGSKKVIAAVGKDGAAVVAFILLAGALLLATSERGRGICGRFTDVAKQVRPPLMEYMAKTTAAGDRVGAFAVERHSEPDPLAVVARRLAIGQSVMTTAEVAAELRMRGFGFAAGRAHQTETRAWLARTPCFHEVRRGSWALGFHAAPLESAGVPG